MLAIFSRCVVAMQAILLGLSFVTIRLSTDRVLWISLVLVCVIRVRVVGLVLMFLVLYM